MRIALCGILLSFLFDYEQIHGILGVKVAGYESTSSFIAWVVMIGLVLSFIQDIKSLVSNHG